LFAKDKNRPDISTQKANAVSQIPHQPNIPHKRSLDFNSIMGWLLAINFCLAIMTLWVQAFWPVALFEIGSFALAAALIVCGKKPAPQACLPLFVLGFVVLWGCIQLTAGWTIIRFETINSLGKWLTWLAIYYVSLCTLNRRGLSEAFQHGIVWFGSIVALEAILQAFLSPNKIFGLFPAAYKEFVMGPILYHTHFAVFIETILPFSLSFGLSNHKNAFAFLSSSAILLTAMVVSASRGGLIIALCEVITVFLLMRPWHITRWKRIAPAALSLAGITVILMLIVGFGTISERFHAETLIPGRLQFAHSSLSMIKARPLTGFGLGCWPSVYPAFATFDPSAYVNQAHNDWLQWTAEGGIFVGLAMLILLFWSLKPALRSIWGIGAVAVLVHATFDYPFSRPATGALPFLILGITSAWNHKIKNNMV
jgi:O-antigen ligase